MKSYIQIVITGIFTWIKVGLVGILFSLVCIGTGAWMLKKNYSSELSFLENLIDKPFASLLIVGSVVGIFYYFILAKKTTVMALVNQVWKNKLSGFVMPKIEVYTNKIMSAQSSKLKSVTGSNIIKQLANSVKKDKTMNRVQRMVLSYGLKDIDLNTIDFSRGDLPQFLALKVENQIHSMTKPPFKLFWIFFFAQLILLALTIVFS